MNRPGISSSRTASSGRLSVPSSKESSEAIPAVACAKGSSNTPDISPSRSESSSRLSTSRSEASTLKSSSAKRLSATSSVSADGVRDSSHKPDISSSKPGSSAKPSALIADDVSKLRVSELCSPFKGSSTVRSLAARPKKSSDSGWLAISAGCEASSKKSDISSCIEINSTEVGSTCSTDISSKSSKLVSFAWVSTASSSSLSRLKSSEVEDSTGNGAIEDWDSSPKKSSLSSSAKAAAALSTSPPLSNSSKSLVDVSVANSASFSGSEKTASKSSDSPSSSKPEISTESVPADSPSEPNKRSKSLISEVLSPSSISISESVSIPEATSPSSKESGESIFNSLPSSSSLGGSSKRLSLL